MVSNTGRTRQRPEDPADPDASVVTGNKAEPGLLIIACGAIAHELMAVIRASDFGAVDVQCLPPEWHNTPQKIAPAVRDRIERERKTYRQIFVAYGDCGTGGELDRVLQEYGVSRLPGNHCYDFLAGSDVFEALASEEPGTFYLTDYLVDNFQRLILDGLGISRHPELREMYFSNYSRLVYLAQDSSLRNREQQAAAAARSLALPLHVHHSGLQPLSNAMRMIHIASA